MKIKVQRDWQLIRPELKAALENYSGTVTDLCKSAKIDYFSARRHLKRAPENQTKSALALCSFFDIEIFMQDKNLQVMLDAINEVWDGSPEHAQSLADLLRWSKSLHGKKQNQLE